MRSILAITLVLFVGSIALADTEVVLQATQSGYMNDSSWAGWSHDGSAWVARFPAGHWQEYGTYGYNSWQLYSYNSVGPGYNGTIYYTDPNLAPNPLSTWVNPYDNYEARCYLTFDLTGVSAGGTAILNLYQGGWASSSGTVTGTIYRMDGADPVQEQQNWNYADRDNPSNNPIGPNAVAWTTAGSDYTTAVGVAYSIDPVRWDADDYLGLAKVSIDIAALVDAAIGASDTTMSIVMIADQDGTPYLDDDDVKVDFLSTSAPQFGGLLGPSLSLPEPATMGLLAIGGLALLRRRR